MFHTKGWKWSVILLLAVVVTAAFLGWKEERKSTSFDPFFAAPGEQLEGDELQKLVFAKPETIPEEGLIFTTTTLEHGQTTCAVLRRTPEGAEEAVASFTFASAPDAGEGVYFRVVDLARETFSSDCSRIAVTKCFAGTTERHAGWMDAEGNFFDVTEALFPEAEGPASPIECYALGFAGCWFGFYEHLPDSASYMDFYVPVDMVKPGAVQGSTLRMIAPSGNNATPAPEMRDGVYHPSEVTHWLDSMRRAQGTK